MILAAAARKEVCLSHTLLTRIAHLGCHMAMIEALSSMRPGPRIPWAWNQEITPTMSDRLILPCRSDLKWQ